MRLGLTFEQVAKITKGNLINAEASAKFDSFTTDTRKMKKGDIFWALKGRNFDGQTFFAAAIETGASLLVGEYGSSRGLDLKKTAVLEVKNTLTALQDLAAYHREKSDLKVAAITGSNGKSTTKQMLLSICQTAAPTIANIGNLNNHIGLPLSLLEIAPEDKYGVFELGASKQGDIVEIAKPAAPDVAIITNISAAHMEFFKDLKTVYETKTEITQGLRSRGILVYNSDDIWLRRLKMEYDGKAISFGFKSGADLQIKNKENFEFIYKGEVFSFDLVLEKHNKLNAAAAAAGAIALGLYKDNIERGLMSFKPMPMRMEEKEKDGVHFILDCYNANPASMQNAIKLLGDRAERPLTAVLGDMKELGKTSKKYHEQLAKVLVGNKIDNVFLAGPEMEALYKVLSTKTANINVEYSLEYKGWLAKLRKTLKSGGTCLVKASRSMNFENIFEEF
ncbi:UDP-N-acetylmuramoyl-tripeptide--D-alanyl-D-alanine ligase [Elusimicrobium posterum]|uniref:UDP-N-acetylmuramoyl-tripeptide--D-alanyl-D- alanine ligase n=1 Tax=Elusimicrobium posterum TaxID=3116653 RepID=UPI003C741445